MKCFRCGSAEGCIHSPSFGTVKVDGQPAPKPELGRIDFRNLELPIVFEVPLEVWFEAAGWPKTVPAGLE